MAALVMRTNACEYSVQTCVAGFHVPMPRTMAEPLRVKLPPAHSRPRKRAIDHTAASAKPAPSATHACAVKLKYAMRLAGAPSMDVQLPHAYSVPLPGSAYRLYTVPLTADPPPPGRSGPHTPVVMFSSAMPATAAPLHVVKAPPMTSASLPYISSDATRPLTPAPNGAPDHPVAGLYVASRLEPPTANESPPTTTSPFHRTIDEMAAPGRPPPYAVHARGTARKSAVTVAEGVGDAVRDGVGVLLGVCVAVVDVDAPRVSVAVSDCVAVAVRVICAMSARCGVPATPMK
jgi:hypothetical protein